MGLLVRSRPRTIAGVVTPVLLVIGVGVFAALEGDFPEAAGDLARPLVSALHRFGHLAPFGLLYAEESGLPMPLPGDVFVMYIGRHLARNAGAWLAAWAAFIAVVVLGSSNLFWISRRVGARLPEYRLGRFLHVTPARIATAQRWFHRWGALALIFGRHIPGFRVPLTIAAGVVGFRYRTFVLSVAVSTAVWVAAFLTIGVVFGGRVEQLVRLHREVYWVIPAAVAVAAAVYFARRRNRQPLH